MSQISVILKNPVNVISIRLFDAVRNILMATVFAWSRVLNPELMNYEFGNSVPFSWAIGCPPILCGQAWKRGWDACSGDSRMEHPVDIWTRFDLSNTRVDLGPDRLYLYGLGRYERPRRQSH